MLKPLQPSNKILRLLFLCLGFYTFSQQYPVQNFTIENGLPSNSVRAIFKAFDGVVWIGTDNGITTLKNGKIEPYFNSKLPATKIWDIAESEYSTLWLATYGKGVYSLKNDTVRRFTTENGLPFNYVRKIHSRNDTIYVGTDRGLSIIVNDEVIANLKHPETNGKLQIQDFFEHQNKTFVITFRSGVYQIDYLGNKPKLLKVKDYDHAFGVGVFADTLFQSTDGNILKYTTKDFIQNKPELSSFGKSVVWDYVKTQNNKIYTACWGVHTDNGGIYEIVDDTMVFKNSDFGINSKEIWCLEYDKTNDFLYVGSLNTGLYRIDLSEKLLFNQTDFPVNGLVNYNEYYNKAIVTEKKLIIVDTLQIHGKPKQVTQIIDNNQFYNFSKEYIAKKTSLKNVNDYYLTEKYNARTLVLNHVEIHQDTIWVSTNIGLFQLSFSGQFLQFYPLHNQLFAFATNGDLVCPVPYNGVFVFKKGDFSKVTYFEPTNKLTPVDVEDIKTIDNVMYLLSRSKGLFTYKDQKFTKVFGNEELVAMTNKDKSNLYLATNLGNIFTFSKNTYKITDTLPKNKYKGHSIQFLEHYKDNLIVGTEKGVNMVSNNPNILIDNEQGLNNRFVRNATINYDFLYLGTNTGWYSLNLNKWLKNNTEHRQEVVLKNIEVNFKPFEIANNLNLNHTQNTIELQWEVENHPYPNKLEYWYRLNDSWIAVKEPKVLLPYLQSGNYSIEVKVNDLHYGNTFAQSLLNINIALPLLKTWWFWLLIIVVLGSFLFLMLKHRFKQIQKRNQEKADIEQRLTETKLEALQSQMNPHFTFNAMNSIQNYIIDNDIDNALYFLSEFSKLIRSTLEYSSLSKISLEDELDYLKSYITVENLRFENKVALNLQIDPKVDVYNTYILPMVLQPFVENCFKHAFTSSIQNPTITLTIKEKDQSLIVQIIDNGVGVNHTVKSTITTSKGMALVKERLQLQQPTIEPIQLQSTPQKGTTVTLTLKI
ncbi:MAG: sensor histidine kinase [Xanthomarina gelatinilytica]|uniref:sensor histidine kinase n=1 Tax=Xanthomarina gelatinilytica TaxID=1137281 RepID=UPI003A86580E